MWTHISSAKILLLLFVAGRQAEAIEITDVYKPRLGRVMADGLTSRHKDVGVLCCHDIVVWRVRLDVLIVPGILRVSPLLKQQNTHYISYRVATATGLATETASIKK